MVVVEGAVVVLGALDCDTMRLLGLSGPPVLTLDRPVMEEAITLGWGLGWVVCPEAELSDLFVLLVGATWDLVVNWPLLVAGSRDLGDVPLAPVALDWLAA